MTCVVYCLEEHTEVFVSEVHRQCAAPLWSELSYTNHSIGASYRTDRHYVAVFVVYRGIAVGGQSGIAVGVYRLIGVANAVVACRRLYHVDGVGGLVVHFLNGVAVVCGGKGG